MTSRSKLLAAALAPFWEFRGYIGEGRRRLEEMLAAVEGSPGARARALNAAGFLVLRAECAALYYGPDDDPPPEEQANL